MDADGLMEHHEEMSHNFRQCETSFGDRAETCLDEHDRSVTPLHHLTTDGRERLGNSQRVSETRPRWAWGASKVSSPDSESFHMADEASVPHVVLG